MTVVPAAWMPAASMRGIVLHWTGGAYEPNAKDLKSYHLLVSGAPKLHRGVNSIKDNESPIRGSYAGHTLNANSGRIGVSICSMGGTDVSEKPFFAGSYPITEAQWDMAIGALAVLAKHYGIPVSPTTILTHAEIQANLGIKQRNKWDITRLVFVPTVVGAKAVGDKLRREVALALDGMRPPLGPPPASLALPRYKVAGVKPSMLNWRKTPGGEVVGAVPENTVVEKLGEEQGVWWRVRSPKGIEGWVSSAYLAAA